MIIKSIAIQNIKSIGGKITVSFEDGTNIFIGPNGGGKSNLMDVLHITLNTYFIWHWQEEIQAYGIITYTRQELENFFDLPKHDIIKDELSQEIEISLNFSEDDISNIRILQENMDLISNQEKKLLNQSKSQIENIFKPMLERKDISGLSQNRNQTYKISANKLDKNTLENSFVSFSEEQIIFYRYLNYFEKVKYLIEKYNEQCEDDKKINEFKYVCKFFSPNRFHEGQSFVISLPGQNRTTKYKQLKEKSSSKTTSDIDYSTYYFASKYNELNRNDEDFAQDEQVVLVKNFLKIVGDYDFTVRTVSKGDNKYTFVVKSEGRQVEFSQLSSGEKEVLNFIFSTIALDLKNAVLIIDEPELHLHPQWQRKLISLYNKMAEDRKLQFIASTHSPVFVNSETIANITRVYKTNKQTKVIPEVKGESWKESLGKAEDLIDIITHSNNAKMFFVDTVILVEGIIDETIFGYLLDKLNTEQKNFEIVAVNGKENYRKYITFLDKFKINSIVICDLDNLWRGDLLKEQRHIGQLRGKIRELLKNKNWQSLQEYLNHEVVKKGITRKAIGLRILEVIGRIRRGEGLNEQDENFISHWLEKCLDEEKILEELNFSEIFNEDQTLTSLDDIISKLKEGISFDNCSHHVFVLKRGSIEDYCDNMSHSKKGALYFLKKLKGYIQSGTADNPKFEDLRRIMLETLKN